MLEDRVFTAWRLRFYGSGAIVAYVLCFAWRVLHGQSFVRPDGRFLCTDFGWMWLSGRFVMAGHPGSVYDPAVFRAAQLAFFGPGNCSTILPFTYPPTFLFLTSPLGLLPYPAAFLVWDLATLIFYLAAVYAIVSRPTALLVALTPFFVPVDLDFAHNGFVTAGLIGFSLVLIERRPWLCGPFLGLLTYKPQFGVLFPPALLISRRWRALASASAGALLLGVGAAVAFGYAAWPSFVAAVLHRHSIMSPDGRVQLWVHSVYGLFYWAGAGALVSSVAQLVLAAVVTSAACAIWARPCPYSLKAAALCLGSATVIPYLLFYDLCVLSIAVAFLVKDVLARGFLGGERTALLACWIALFLVRMPIGAIVSLALLALVVRRSIALPVAGSTAAEQREAPARIGSMAG
jgi:hypothetical protein